MKTTSLIQFTVLAAVLLAWANVDASNDFYERLQPDGDMYCDGASTPGTERSTAQIIMCIMKLIAMNDLTPAFILKCLTQKALPIDDHFVTFIITSSQRQGVVENGKIMNAELTWGNWQQGGRDVDTVNNIKFGCNNNAIFTAMGRQYSPSGTAGFFEIHDGGEIIATVQFVMPFMGPNKFIIRQVDGHYKCADSGFVTFGSPTITISCQRLLFTK